MYTLKQDVPQWKLWPLLQNFSVVKFFYTEYGLSQKVKSVKNIFFCTVFARWRLIANRYSKDANDKEYWLAALTIKEKKKLSS